MPETAHRPLLLPAGCFLAGQALGPGWPLLATALLLAALLGAPRAGRRFRLALGGAAALVLGATMAWLSARVPPDSIELRPPSADVRPVLVRGQLSGLLRRTRSASGEGVVADLRVDSLRVGRIELPLRGDVLLLAEAEAASLLESAGRIEAWVTLRRPREPRNFGLRPWPEPPLLARVTAKELITTIEPRRSLMDRFRARVARGLDESSSGLGRGLARALVLGLRDELDRDLQRRLRDGGTAHVLAVSGLHVALVAWAAGWVAALCGMRSRGQALTVLAVCWTFALLAGFGLPVLRAATLVSCFSLGRLSARGVDSWNALAAAVLLTGLLRPESTFGVGWFLTYGATASLLLLTRPLSSLLPEPRRLFTAWLSDGLAASTAAWLGLFLLQLVFFGSVNPLAPLLNLLLVPVASLATCAALVGALTSTVSPLLASPVLHLVQCCAELLGLFDPAGWRLFAWPAPGWTVGWAACGLAWALPRDPRIRWAAALGAAVLAVFVLRDANPPPGLRLTVLDVGQGSSTLLEIPDARGGCWTALLDGGGRPGSVGDVGEETVVPALRALGLRRLDAVLLSHPDYDHRGGLPAVVRAFRPREVLVAPSEEPAALAELREAARAAGARFGMVAAGSPIGPEGGGLDVLWPPREAAERGWLGGNDLSLVLRLRRAERGLALLPGDVEAAGEAGLLDSGRELAAGVLVTPHHGSRSSSSPAFLAAVEPRLGVVSAGYRNRFGHPHPEVVERLGAAWLTSELGAVRFRFEGELVHVDCAGSTKSGVLSLVRPEGAWDHPRP